jgi:hypothetical protein
MTKVYQTIINKTNGNCQAAVWASLLNIKITEVPNFVEYEDDHEALCQFLEPFGYGYSRYLINPNRKDLPEETKSQYEFFATELPETLGFNGYYEATVYSPGFWDEQRYREDPAYKPVCHAVVIDRQFHIVHDPNPNNYDYKMGLKQYPLAEQLGYNGIIGVSLFSRSAN